MPLMVTGGIRRRAVAEQVLASGVSVAGLAAALALNPRLPIEWRAGVEGAAALRPVTWKNKMAGAMAAIAMVRHQDEPPLARPRTTPRRLAAARAGRGPTLRGMAGSPLPLLDGRPFSRLSFPEGRGP